MTICGHVLPMNPSCGTCALRRGLGRDLASASSYGNSTFTKTSMQFGGFSEAKHTNNEAPRRFYASNITNETKRKAIGVLGMISLAAIVIGLVLAVFFPLIGLPLFGGGIIGGGCIYGINS